MGWENDLFAMFDDLEGQAAALWEADREAELADRARSEYAAVTLASRLMASVGASVVLELPGVGRVEGRMARVGESWALIEGSNQDWIVPLRHAQVVHGASQRSVPEVAWSPLARLGLPSALRRLAEAGTRCLLHLIDGARHEAYAERVGADFLECRTSAGAQLLVPFNAIVAVQSRDD